MLNIEHGKQKIYISFKPEDTKHMVLSLGSICLSLKQHFEEKK